MDTLPPLQARAVITLDIAAARYNLDRDLRDRVADRLKDKPHRQVLPHVRAYLVADAEEAILLDRDYDFSPQCATPYPVGSRHCSVCGRCLMCDL